MDRSPRTINEDLGLGVKAGKSLVRQHERSGLKRPPSFSKLIADRSGGVVDEEPVSNESMRVPDGEVVDARPAVGRHYTDI